MQHAFMSATTQPGRALRSLGAPGPAPNQSRPASCRRSRLLRNDSLRAVFLAAARHYSCVWPSRGLWSAASVVTTPLTAEPEVDEPLVPANVAGQADFLLDAWRSRLSRDGGLQCWAAQRSALDAPRLVISQFWGWHADLGYERAQHRSRDASVAVRQRVCAHYAAMHELLYRQPAAPARKSIGLLMYASEPGSTGTLAAVERLLDQRASINPADVILVHLNLGTMLDDEAALRQPRWSRLKQWARKSSPSGRERRPAASWRLRQGYWHSLLWQLSSGRGPEQRRRKSLVCASSEGGAAKAPPTPVAPEQGTPSASADAASRPHARFLMLGGAPKLFRGLVLLEMARRGLLQRGLWSAAEFDFCRNRTAWLTRSSWDAAPFGQDEQSRLLADAPLVHSLCKLLPRVLDVAPQLKTQILAMGDDRLWRGTRFSLTFESLMPDERRARETVFVTEKLAKPMLHGHPFVLLGPPGALAALRCLGFRTFSGQVNERYDLLLDGRARLDAALAEVERMSRLHASSWLEPALMSSTTHNQRHLVCGGLYRVMLAQAQALLLMAAQQGGWMNGTDIG